MHIEPEKGLSKKELDKLEKETGFLKEPVPYDEKKMLETLERDDVESVKVFKKPLTKNQRKRQRKKPRK